MRFVTSITVLLLALSGVAALAQQPPGGSPPSSAAVATAKDPAATALLKRMCDRLQASKTYTVKGRASLELPVTGGELATFYNDFETSVRRPGSARRRRNGGGRRSTQHRREQ
jgi:hypothetical protein